MKKSKNRPVKSKKVAQPKQDLWAITIDKVGYGGLSYRARLIDDGVLGASYKVYEDTLEHDTPGEALAALGRRIDRELIRLGFMITDDSKEEFTEEIISEYRRSY